MADFWGACSSAPPHPAIRAVAVILRVDFRKRDPGPIDFALQCYDASGISLGVLAERTAVGSIIVTIPDIPDASLIYDENETRAILRFFWPESGGTIDGLNVTNAVRSC